jgi:heptosyltransferase-1
MRILIIKLSSIGDLFHALPAVHALKVGLNAPIDWVTTTAYVDLVNCFDDVDHAIAFPRKHFFKNLKHFKKQLRTHHYDLIIDLQGLLKSATVARLARGGRRIGPSFHREASHLFYSTVAGICNKDRHAVLENLDIADHLGIESQPLHFPVTFPDITVSGASPRIAISPTSRWETKNWPLERFAAVAKELQESQQATIVLLGGPDDIDACQHIESALDAPCENWAGKTTLVEMGSQLQTVDLLIANDSGPVHMAAAIGKPTLVIFGPTKPHRTGPFGEGHHVIQTSLPCQPCGQRTCSQPDPGVPCMTGISVTEVTKAAHAMLA